MSPSVNHSLVAGRNTGDTQGQVQSRVLDDPESAAVYNVRGKWE